MKTIKLTIILILTSLASFAQVGIGNTDPKASLDITASNTATPSNTDGILIPKIDNFPATNPGADQNGMMVFVTGNGTPTKGFYYWDNTLNSWVSVVGTKNTLDGAYDEGGPGAGRIINALNGAVEITGNSGMEITRSSSDPIAKTLELNSVLDSNGAEGISQFFDGDAGTGSYKQAFAIDNYIRFHINDGLLTGLRNQFVLGNNSGASTTGNIGINNDFYSGTNTGFDKGVYNRFSMTTPNQYGVHNQFDNTGNVGYGVYNTMYNTVNTNITGLHNYFYNNGSGNLHGSYTQIFGSNTGDKYGHYIEISATSPGLHYGIFSQVESPTGFSGLFRGRVSIGSNSSNYIMPMTDGLSGQVMTTNGAGNVTFTTPVILTDTDNQTIDNLTLNGTVLELSLEDDGQPLQTLNLASIATKHDWYEESTTAEPNAITDDIYTQGHVAIGKNTADFPLDIIDNSTVTDPVAMRIEGNGTGTNIHTGLEIEMNSNGAFRTKGVYLDLENSGTDQRTGFETTIRFTNENATGFRSTIRGTGGNIGFNNSMIDAGSTSNVLTRGISNEIGQRSTFGTYGTHNSLYADGTGATGYKYATYNSIIGGTGTHIGTRNSIQSEGTGQKYGVYNLFGSPGYNTDGSLYGTYNDFYNGMTTTGDKLGTYTTIPSGLAGTHYGLYMDVQNTSGYAAYLIGRTSLGNGTINRYLMPATDGTNNQVLTTDGAGNVTFQDIAVGDSDWYEVGTTNPPNAINDDKYSGGNIAIGKNTIDVDSKVDIESSNKLYTINLNNTTNSGSGIIGINNRISSNIGQTGIMNELDGNAYAKIGIRSNFQGTGFSTMNHYGAINSFNTVGHAFQVGLRNEYTSTNNSGINDGVYNLFSSDNYSGTLRGMYNSFSGSNTAFKYGLYNSHIGAGSGVFYGTYTTVTNTGTSDKYGHNVTISNTAGGTHYGIYSDVIKTNSYAGYFLGRVAIGTTVGNNYILPNFRGTNGQIMQTDGTGNVTWQDPNTGTDNQQIDTFSFNTTTNQLTLEVQNDGQPAQIVDLSSLNPQKAIARVYMNVSQTETGGGIAKVNFDTTEFDIGNNFNTITDEYAAPQTSVYRITTQITMDASTGTGTFDVRIRINGAQQRRTEYNHTGNGQVVRQVSSLLSLTAGDTVDVAFSRPAIGATIQANSRVSFFEIEQI